MSQEQHRIVNHLSTSIRLGIVVFGVFGVAYCLLVTGLAQVVWPAQASGSLLRKGGEVVGSVWVGQAFDDPRYFIGRPSASGYDPMAMAGSNLARSNPELTHRLSQREQVLRERLGLTHTDELPSDLLSQSGSGNDPHISVASAYLQVPAVARARGVSNQDIKAIVDAHVEQPQWGILGASRVNVLELNLALDNTVR